MPYRTIHKPKQRPPWDPCRCRWTPSLYIKLNNGEAFDFNSLTKRTLPSNWQCCRCADEGKAIYVSQYTAEEQFCANCGHARDLKDGELEENYAAMFPGMTHSKGPR